MAKPQTPCLVCRTEAQQGKPFMADRGMDWPVTEVAGHTVHEACASRAEHLAQTVAEGGFEVDAAGIGRWTTNGRVVPRESAALLEALGLAGALDSRATDIARDEELTAFLASYRANPPQYDAEQIAEMRAVFGPGEKVVDVITGRRII